MARSLSGAQEGAPDAVAKVLDWALDRDGPVRVLEHRTKTGGRRGSLPPVGWKVRDEVMV